MEKRGESGQSVIFSPWTKFWAQLRLAENGKKGGKWTKWREGKHCKHKLKVDEKMEN